MKTNLKPQEYYYLYSPLGAKPVEMMVYTLKGLCFSGDIELFSKFIYINQSDTKKRSRSYMRLNPNRLQQKRSLAEDFILALFTPGEELRVYELRARIEEKLNKQLQDFKTRYVYADVKEKGFCRWKYLLTLSGRAEKNRCATLIDTTEQQAKLPKQNTTQLKQMLLNLGSNAIFLDDDAQSKLNIYSAAYNELDLLFGVGQDGLPPSGSYTIGGMGGFGGGGYSGGGGGFSGFGGGSFGGGGAGGSW